jgi:hypothetical protein
MDYLIFWNKILIKRAVDLIKQSPVVFIGMIVAISAFFIGRQNAIIVLNIKMTAILLSIFAVLSIIASLKNHDTILLLIAHSKSNLQNKHIKIGFFIKQSFKNNLPLIVFDFFLFTGLIKTDNYLIIPLITGSIVSLVFSFFFMYLKNGYDNKNVKKIAGKKSNVSPLVKSVFYDYLTYDFLVLAILCYAFFAVIFIAVLPDMLFIKKMENPSIVLTAFTAILSIGIMGIIESIPNINWKFLSIIYPLNISTHIKKTALFMVRIFGLLFIVSILITLHISILSLIKYLYCIIALLLFSIFNAFTQNNVIIKAIRSIVFSVLVIWLGTLNSALLFLSIIPLFISALLAKDDYRECYLQ